MAAMSSFHSEEAGSSSNSSRAGGVIPMGDIITTSSRPFHPAGNCLPIVSRLDRLDSLMRFLEEKRDGGSRTAKMSCTSSSRSVFSMKRKNVPLDLAVKDAQSRGSLLDRVIALENQLAQLCLEMEYRSGASSLAAKTSAGLSSHDSAAAAAASSSKPYDHGKRGFPYSFAKIWTTTTTSSQSQQHLQKQQASHSQPLLPSQVIGPAFNTSDHGLQDNNNNKYSSTEDDQRDQEKPSKHELASTHAKQSRKTKEERSSPIRSNKKATPPTWLHLRFLGC